MRRLFWHSCCNICLLKIQSEDNASKYFYRCYMNNKERLALADRVQRNIQQNHSQYRIYREKEKIEKEFKRD